MCGRYATTMGQISLYGTFDAEPDPLDAVLNPTGSDAGPAPADGDPAGRVDAGEALPDIAAGRYNIAPTSTVPIVLERRPKDEDGIAGDVHRYLRAVRWGLVPSWAKDLSIGQKLFNARADTVPTKPAFRKAVQSRRCLVPASGFFEWRKIPVDGSSKPDKQPFYITPSDGSVMAFAGLWEFWKSPAGEPLVSTTIITTDAVGDMAQIHDRMPLILPAADWDAWLSLDNGTADVLPLLAPPEEEFVAQLEFRPVSSRVGNVRNDDPALLEPVSPHPGALF